MCNGLIEEKEGYINMGIRTVLFDLDGTLIDTNELIIKSFEHTFSKYGFSFTREEIMDFNGPPLRDTFTSLNKEFAEEMLETYRSHNHLIHDQYIKLFPNIIETLDILKEKKVPVGIVTAKMRVGVDLGLKLTGLDQYFKTIVTIDDVTNPKPHPESVIKAMKELNGEPKSTIMVGDNYHDILAGKNARVLTAGVAWSHRGEEFLKQYEPTYMFRTMKDLLDLIEV